MLSCINKASIGGKVAKGVNTRGHFMYSVHKEPVPFPRPKTAISSSTNADTSVQGKHPWLNRWVLRFISIYLASSIATGFHVLAAPLPHPWETINYDAAAGALKLHAALAYLHHAADPIRRWSEQRYVAPSRHQSTLFPNQIPCAILARLPRC